MIRWIFCILLMLGLTVVYVFTGTMPALLLLCSFPAVLLFEVLMTIFAVKHIKIKLSLPPSIQKGEAVQGSIQLINYLPIPIVHAALKVRLHNELTREEQVVPITFSLSLLRRKRVEFQLQSSHCGQFFVSCEELILCDPFRLISLKQKIDLNQHFLIMPELFSMQVHLNGNRAQFGEENSTYCNCKGQDWSEPFQIREYIEGDSLKQIHWKLSRKLGRYLVTDPTETLEQKILVFWDQGALAETAAADIPDALAEVVTSFCLTLTQNEIPYSVTWSDKDGKCMLRNITTLENLYETIPQMLYEGMGNEGHSPFLEYDQQLAGKYYPIIAYFSDHISSKLSELSTVGNPTLFLCSDNAETEAAGDFPCWLFSSTDYQKALSSIAI